MGQEWGFILALLSESLALELKVPKNYKRNYFASGLSSETAGQKSKEGRRGGIEAGMQKEGERKVGR